MKIFYRIAFWLAAIAFLAIILTSLDYSLAQALFVSLLFCPCALALEYWMPKTVKTMDRVYLSLAILASAIVMIIILHLYIGQTLNANSCWERSQEVPPMLVNPAFIGLILTSISFGDFYWTRWLSKHFKDKDRSITFFSDRRSVTLKLADIAYIESNDTEVRIISASGESYRNKTGIGQWENLLGDRFLRIHRSYLVNITLASLIDPSTVSVAEMHLPVSRKYKDAVSSTFSRLPESSDDSKTDSGSQSQIRPGVCND